MKLYIKQYSVCRKFKDFTQGFKTKFNIIMFHLFVQDQTLSYVETEDELKQILRVWLLKLSVVLVCEIIHPWI